ncbi:MAG: hypothetical protein KJS68_01930, partial [Alphaproteobacteria bacterium]|nr:hypothetical protein [Alphaproteobacteria bacterium]
QLPKLHTRVRFPSPAPRLSCKAYAAFYSEFQEKREKLQTLLQQQRLPAHFPAKENNARKSCRGEQPSRLG